MSHCVEGATPAYCIICKEHGHFAAIHLRTLPTPMPRWF